MATHHFKGIDASQELDQKRLIRDTRGIYQQVMDMVNSREMSMALLLTCAGAGVIMPQMTHLFLFIGCILYFMRGSSSKLDKLPLRMPKQHKGLDYSSPVPGRTGFKKGEGVFYFGNEFNTNHELWGAIPDMLTHMLVFGTTGSGKTEFLVSMSFNAIAMGSGFSYIDPKAAPKLMAQIYVLARICGRDDDFRTINFLTSDKGSDPNVVSPIRTTNTTNPFAYGNAESMADILISLIPEAEGGNAIFNKNAQALMRATMYGLVEKRDKGELDLSAETIRERLTLKACCELAEDDTISPHAKASIGAFLTSVGWQEGVRMDRQPRSLPEQFGYARSYFGEPLNSLTDTYGHIYRTNHGEIDMKDVIMNRRILVTALPSLAVAPEELKNLGKIVLSSTRNAISTGLGDGREGTFADTIFSLPTDAPAPFLSITDEYAAIPTPGYVEVLTQGRGLGIAALVASQDYAGIKKGDEKGAQQMLENTKYKFILKMESATDTWETVKALAGEGLVMESGGMAIDKQNASVSYTDQLSANAQLRSRITLQDLQQQVEGEFHLFNNGNIVRGSSFYADVPLDPNMQFRIPTMLTIDMPDKRRIEAKYGKTKRIVDYLLSVHNGDSTVIEEVSDVAVTKSISALISAMDPKINLSRMDKAIAAIIEIKEGRQRSMQGVGEAQTLGGDALKNLLEESDEFGSEADPLDQFLDAQIDGGDDDLDLGNLNEVTPIIDDAFNENISQAAQALGETPEQASSGATEVTEAVTESIRYPDPPLPTGESQDDLIASLDQMIDGFQTGEENE